MRLRPLAFAALLLIGAADRPKPPASQLPTLGETIEVSIVNVDVFVTDKSGKRVQGLTKDDFVVFENGQQQPISNFAEYAATTTATAPAPAAAPAEQPVDQRRNVVLFVERFRLPKANADPMFASMKKLLRETIRPGDAAMVVTWYRGEMKTLQGYTDDLGLIDKAVDAVARQSTSAMIDEYERARVDADDVVDFELDLDEFYGSTDAAPMHQAFEETKGVSQRMEALRARGEMQQKVRSINALIRSMAGLDGKRVLLMATHRLSQYAGAEFYWAAGVNSELESLDRIELDTRNIIRSLYETANANGVTVYPMYPEGLISAMTPIDGRRMTGVDAPAIDFLIQNNETPTLQEIARQTGGVAAWGTGNVTKLLTTISDDFNTYYSLAYRTTPRSLDKSRSIVVKTRDPKYVVRSRRGVTEKSDVTRMEDRVLSSLFRADEGARLKFAVHLGEKQPRGKRYRIPVTIRIPVAALTVLPNGANYSGGFSVYVAWGAKVGGISEATRRRQLFHIPADDLVRAKRSYYTYQFDIAADARTERLSLGVVDEVSKEYGLRVYDLRQQ